MSRAVKPERVALLPTGLPILAAVLERYGPRDVSVPPKGYGTG